MQRFMKLSTYEKRLLLECTFAVYKWKCRLLFSSFKKLADKSKSISPNLEPNPNELDALKKTFERVNKLTFWQNKCLVNTFAARQVLNKRNYSSIAFLGVDNSSKDALTAHAWIVSNGIEIIPSDAKFSSVHEF